MATVEEGLCFSSLGRDVERIDRELAELERAMNRPGGDRHRAIVASRIEAAARALRRKLDQQSATFWLLFQDPARHSQANQIHARIGSMFDRILGLLGPPDQRLGDDSLAEKVQKIQELNKEIAGYKTPSASVDPRLRLLAARPRAGSGSRPVVQSGAAFGDSLGLRSRDAEAPEGLSCCDELPTENPE